MKSDNMPCSELGSSPGSRGDVHRVRVPVRSLLQLAEFKHFSVHKLPWIGEKDGLRFALLDVEDANQNIGVEGVVVVRLHL